MGLRETNAWIGLASIAVVFGSYFARLGLALRAGPVRPEEFLGQFVGSVVLLVLLQVVLAIVVALATRAPADGEVRPDERERLIELKASRPALPVVQLGAVLAAASVSLGAPALLTANGLVLSLVLAELVRLGGQIGYFRLGVS